MSEKPGVYLFKDRKGTILYIGKANNLKKRVKTYFKPLSALGKLIAKVDHILVESEFEALLLEAELIKKNQPKYNKLLKDDKSFLYIKISQEEIPRVYPCRKIQGGFGPYPQATTVRSVLRYLRRVFPYRSCRNLPKKPCLFYDLKLCPGFCVNQNPKTLLRYRRHLTYLKNLLMAKGSKVTRSLKTEMKAFSSRQNYEEAARIRNQIRDLAYLAQKRHLTHEYLENPNLYYDLRQKELIELKKLLHLEKPINKIEGYDISNVSGTNATGSMVTFINGEADKSFYRRFKIRTKKTPDDVAMMKEVILRRLGHPEWGFPDLIAIDGGKPQVKGVSDVLNDVHLNIPVVGLAKQKEEIICMETANKWRVEKLPQDSLALNLLKRIRDEAHRFAHKYHVNLRTLV